jgi:hypothetical protein
VKRAIAREIQNKAKLAIVVKGQVAREIQNEAKLAIVVKGQVYFQVNAPWSSYRWAFSILYRW